MNTITYTKARQELAKTMDQVCEDHSPVVITRGNTQAVVMVSLEDFQAITNPEEMEMSALMDLAHERLTGAILAVDEATRAVKETRQGLSTGGAK